MHAMNAAAADPAFARCAAWLRQDPALVAQLAALESPDDFVPALAAAVAARGDDADAAAIAGALAHTRALPPWVVDDWRPEHRRGWEPVALEWGPRGAGLVWCAGQVPDTLPFHEMIVSRVRYRPFNRWFALHTPLTPDFVASLQAEALPLAGLVHHLSRCGSTLLGQALKAWPGTRVVSEAALLDSALLVALGGADPDWLAFRGALAALSQPGGDATRVIVKLDAWHALALGPLRERLPRVPWAFACRDPLEVLVSHAREPGRHTVPGMLPDAWLGAADPAATAPIEHAARVLAAICAAVVPHASAGLLVDHRELAGGDGAAFVATQVAPWFGLDPAAADPQRLAEAFATHAKRPNEPYADDRGAKRTAATDALRAAAARIQPHYAALDAARLRQRTAAPRRGA